jgi:ubiquinone/menaquinone biosynthesis C-methylase UbiE
MNTDTIQRLLALNYQFYQTFAAQFSATRQRLQPGVLRLLQTIPLTSRLLDLGCGNGGLARQLAQSGYQGEYLGLDFSVALLAQVAQGRMRPSLTWRWLLPCSIIFPGRNCASEYWKMYANCWFPAERSSILIGSF